MPKLQLAVQLYTVRDLLITNTAGTLKNVRAAGYTRVELAGLGSHAAAEWNHMLADCGLTPVAIHSPIDQLESGIAGIIDTAAILNVRHVVCPWLPEERRKDEAGWKRCAASLTRSGAALNKHKIQLSYHNHSFEFVRFGSRYAMDLLIEETDPALVHFELDTYWIKHGGEEPKAYIEKLNGRCPLIHLKDMSADDKRAFAEVGTGILDFPAIFKVAEQSGSEYGIVEQDVCPGDPIESIRISFENLQRMALDT